MRDFGQSDGPITLANYWPVKMVHRILVTFLGVYNQAIAVKQLLMFIQTTASTYSISLFMIMNHFNMLNLSLVIKLKFFKLLNLAFK